MKKRFDFVVTFILNYVTCGIYALYMWYTMTENNNRIARKYGIPEIRNFIIAMLLGVITCGIYEIYWMYKFMEQQVAINRASGVESKPTDSPVVLLLLMFVPVYSYYVLCDNHNRGVDINPDC